VRPKTRLTSAMADPPTTCARMANLRCRSMSMPGAYCVRKDWTIWAVRFFWKPRDGCWLYVPIDSYTEVAVDKRQESTAPHQGSGIDLSASGAATRALCGQ